MEFSKLLKQVQDNKISEIKIQKNKISLEELKRLAEALEKNTSVTSVDLEENKIGVEGATVLADILKKNQTITKLNLGNNKISAGGAIALAEALKHNSTLKELDLRGNGIGKKGAEAVAVSLQTNASVTSLCLNNNKLGKEGLISFIGKLKGNKTIRHLYLSYNNSNVPWGYTYSHLSANDVTSLVDFIKSSSSLTVFYFTNNRVTDSAIKTILEALENNTSIITLNLADNFIGSKTANALAKLLGCNKVLRRVSLAASEPVVPYTSLADAMRQTRSYDAELQTQTRIDNEAANHIAEALKTNTSLLSLNLNNHLIYGDAFATAIKENKGLKRLCLEHNFFGKEGGQAFATAMQANKTLIEFNYKSCRISKEDSETIDAIITANRERAEQFLKAVENNELDKVKQLVEQEVNINVQNENGDTALHIAAREGYQVIVDYLLTQPLLLRLLNDDDEYPEVEPSRFPQIAQVPTQSPAMVVAAHPGLPNEFANQLTQLQANDPSLTVLNIHGNIGANSIAALGKVLATNKTLQELNFSNIRWGKYSSKYSHAFDEFINGLIANNSLLKLDMSFCHIVANKIDLMANFLSSNQTLLELKLVDCELDKTSVKILANGLQKNHTLSKLNIARHGTYGNHCGEEGGQALVDALKDNTALTELNYTSTRVRKEAAQTIDRITEANLQRAKQLLQAAKTNQVELVKQYLAQGVNINYWDENGDTALHLAARAGHVTIVDLLLKQPKIQRLPNAKGEYPSVEQISSQSANQVSQIAAAASSQLEPLVKHSPKPSIQPSSSKIDSQAKLATALKDTGFSLGQAQGEGDCFFDACAQALNAITGTSAYSIQSLRLLSHNYAHALDQQTVGPGATNWIYQRFLANANGNQEHALGEYQKYLDNVVFTAAEKNGDDVVWGEQDIDGRIICEKLQVKLHVIELHDQMTEPGDAPIVHQLLDGQGNSQSMNEDQLVAAYQNATILHVANIASNLHFMPVLAKNAVSHAAPTASQAPANSANQVMLKDVPANCRCPITHQIMFDPVVAADGETYEREAIERHLANSDKSPSHQIPLAHKFLTTNRALKQLIHMFLEQPDASHLVEDLYFSDNLQQQAIAAVEQGDLNTIQRLCHQDERILYKPLSEDGLSAGDTLMSLVCQTSHLLMLQYVANRAKNYLAKLADAQQYQLMTIGAQHYESEGLKTLANAFGWEQANYQAYAFAYVATATPLMEKIISLLLESGLDIAAQDQEGNSLLHWAIKRDAEGLIHLLLTHPHAANLHALTNHQQLTPLQLAKQLNQQTAITLLESNDPMEDERLEIIHEVKWAKDLTVFYGSPTSKLEISDKCHIDFRTAALNQKRDGRENLLFSRLTFIYKTPAKTYEKCAIDLANVDSDEQTVQRDGRIHVRTEYRTDEELKQDLLRYHPERKEEIEQTYRSTQNFHMSFYHSERALFKYLENPQVLKSYVDHFSAYLHQQHNVAANQVKLSAVLLDMHSTRYLCDWCEPALAYFQHPSSEFAQRLKTQVTANGIKLSNKDPHADKALFIITRYSAEQPCGDERQQRLRRKPKALHETGLFDLKLFKRRLKEDNVTTILQRDNKTNEQPYSSLLTTTSRLPKDNPKVGFFNVTGKKRTQAELKASQVATSQASAAQSHEGNEPAPKRPRLDNV